MTHSFQNVHAELDGSVLRVTIDRIDSRLNAVNGDLHAELGLLFSELRSETEARAILLTGAGDAFSAGGDYGWFPALADPVTREDVRRTGKQLIWDLLDIEVPIVVALNGHAIGLGATIALLGDALFMSEDAVIADPHVKVGIVAGDGGTAIWPLLLGPLLAKRYLLTGDPLSAADALRLGLATHVVEPAALDAEAMAFAQKLASGAPLALRYTKMAVNKLVKEALNIAFDVATAYEVVTLASDDHKEALAAIAERRPPEFRGR